MYERRFFRNLIVSQSEWEQIWIGDGAQYLTTSLTPQNIHKHADREHRVETRKGMASQHHGSLLFWIAVNHSDFSLYNVETVTKEIMAQHTSLLTFEWMRSSEWTDGALVHGSTDSNNLSMPWCRNHAYWIWYSTINCTPGVPMGMCNNVSNMIQIP